VVSGSGPPTVATPWKYRLMPVAWSFLGEFNTAVVTSVYSVGTVSTVLWYSYTLVTLLKLNE
jgi:hypothetical protein